MQLCRRLLALPTFLVFPMLLSSPAFSQEAKTEKYLDTTLSPAEKKETSIECSKR